MKNNEQVELVAQQSVVSVPVYAAPPDPLSTIEIFASLARDPSIPVDRIKQLMDLQPRLLSVGRSCGAIWGTE